MFKTNKQSLTFNHLFLFLLYLLSKLNLREGTKHLETACPFIDYHALNFRQFSFNIVKSLPSAFQQLGRSTDTVNCDKGKHYATRGIFLDWYRSYLSGRKWDTSVNESNSVHLNFHYFFEFVVSNNLNSSRQTNNNNTCSIQKIFVNTVSDHCVTVELSSRMRVWLIQIDHHPSIPFINKNYRHVVM